MRLGDLEHAVDGIVFRCLVLHKNTVAVYFNAADKATAIPKLGIHSVCGGRDVLTSVGTSNVHEHPETFEVYNAILWKINGNDGSIRGGSGIALGLEPEPIAVEVVHTAAEHLH